MLAYTQIIADLVPVIKQQCDAIAKKNIAQNSVKYVLYVSGGLHLMAKKAKTIKWYRHFYVHAALSLSFLQCAMEKLFNCGNFTINIRQNELLMQKLNRYT